MFHQWIFPLQVVYKVLNVRQDRDVVINGWNNGRHIISFLQGRFQRWRATGRNLYVSCGELPLEEELVPLSEVLRVSPLALSSLQVWIPKWRTVVKSVVIVCAWSILLLLDLNRWERSLGSFRSPISCQAFCECLGWADRARSFRGELRAFKN